MGRKILIGYDGSPHGKDALRLGKQLCQVCDASALVATCVPFPKYPMDPPELEIAVEQDTAPLFAEAEAALAPIEVETCSMFDRSPGRAIHGLAESVQPLAVVIGSAHRGAIGRILAGSVGRALMSGAPCSVAIAPRGYADGTGEHLLRIGAAVDGGTESIRALDEAVSIAERLHATLTIISVVSNVTLAYGAAPGYMVGDLSGIQQNHARKVLNEAADRVPNGLPVTTMQPEGDAGLVLAEISAELDLLVVGSRAYGPLKRVLLGGVSDRLSRSAKCPLLVVPRGAAANDLDPGAAVERGALAGAGLSLAPNEAAVAAPPRRER